MSDELPDASNRTYKTPEEVERDRLLREAAYQVQPESPISHSFADGKAGISTSMPTRETAMPTKQFSTSAAVYWNQKAQTGWISRDNEAPVFVSHKPKDEADMLTEFPMRLLWPL